MSVDALVWIFVWLLIFAIIVGIMILIVRKAPFIPGEWKGYFEGAIWVIALIILLFAVVSMLPPLPKFR